jgi:o-succinylbenzoate---CoA ligase
MAKLAVVGYCHADAYLHAAPLCHIGGLSSALAVLLAGAAQVFMPRCRPGLLPGARAAWEGS